MARLCKRRRIEPPILALPKEVMESWQAAATQRIISQLAMRCSCLEESQRPKTVDKLKSFSRSALQTGVKLYCFAPRDVAIDMHSKGLLSDNEKDEIAELLQDALPLDGGSPVPRAEWPQDGKYGWLMRKAPPMPVKSRALWIVDSSFVVIRVAVDAFVAELQKSSLFTIEGTSLGYSADIANKSSSEHQSLDLQMPFSQRWNANFQPSLKGKALSVRTALLISLPESCSHFQAVQDIRKQYDPAYERWMPHVNLVYPFLPSASFTLGKIRRKLEASVVGFDLTFDDVGVLEHGRSRTYYLKPNKDGEEKLQDLFRNILLALPDGPCRGGKWIEKTIDKGKGKGKYPDKGKGKGKGKDKDKGKGKGEEEIEEEENAETSEAEEEDPPFLPHLTLMKEDLPEDAQAFQVGDYIKSKDGKAEGYIVSFSFDNARDPRIQKADGSIALVLGKNFEVVPKVAYYSKEMWIEWLRSKLTLPVRQGVGATITGVDGEVWGKVSADEGEVWKLESGRIAKKATEGQKWVWLEDKNPGVQIRIDKILICERGEDTPFEIVEELKLGASAASEIKSPSSGIGATICGIDGSVWGKVVQDADKVWKLESGRIAKKETEGDRWRWHSPS